MNLDNFDVLSHFLIFLFWILWSTVHSLLIQQRIMDLFQRILKNKFRFYRLFYIIFSVISLAPVIYYWKIIESPIIFEWRGGLRIIQGSLVLASLILFYSGARRYNFKQFLGFKQIKEGNLDRSLSKSGKVDTSEILSLIRHPWYTGIFLIIWARELRLSDIVVNTVIVFYVIIGTYLEEKKLEHEFGDEYKKYREKVSRFFPMKWITSKIFKI